MLAFASTHRPFALLPHIIHFTQSLVLIVPNMQLTQSIVVLGSLTASAIAVARPAFVIPDFVPVERRQTSGPVYECHSDCGW